MKKLTFAALALVIATGNLFASEPDGLTLPAGFHATVVAEGLGSIRHMAIRSNGDIYISTRHGGKQPSTGILALRLDADHKQAQVEHFSSVDQGTGIRIYKGALYASSNTAVYRFPLEGNALVPTAEPQTIVEGLAPSGHMIAFDGKGKLYVSFDAGMNICATPNTPKGEKPTGLKPCPALATRAGIWSFDDSRTGQKFSDGEHFATGVRTLSGLDWRNGDALYSATHGRDATHDAFPDLVTEDQDNVIADELFRVEKSTDMGWPYTYYDGARKLLLLAPEYGGDGKTAPTEGHYATPAAAFFQPRRPAVLDLVFYQAKQFPALYRGGAFLAMHGAADVQGPSGQAGYDIVFVPFKGNKAGTPVIFADGFAGPNPADKNVKTAAYRPVGVAVGPDGALYVADSNKGRIWRIAYTGKP
ncbi:PQQ-dependent sugar dehydrogenase [Terriglobus sp. ADX1]|uniref:PQQ-dependent sugar dehydrogenase n=1 Tax=Terriglobus sp. ADX1 TaxID=2794063 RepID=UPI002FE548BD